MVWSDYSNNICPKPDTLLFVYGDKKSCQMVFAGFATDLY